MAKTNPTFVTFSDTKPKPVATAVSSKKDPTTKGLQKTCSICGKTTTLDGFFYNKGNITGLKRDSWCKDCVKGFVGSQEALRKYMFENCRAWSPKMWDEATTQAIKDANMDKRFAAMTTEEERNRAIEDRASVISLAIMNTGANYKFVNNSAIPEGFDFDKNLAEEMAIEKNSDDPYFINRVLSKEWRGSYTQYEIDQMDQYYDEIIKTRGIEDAVGERYARLFVKQSFLVDDLCEKSRSNPSDKDLANQYKDALSALDTMSRAGQLAPRDRKADATLGLGSLGMFIRAMEYGEKLMVEPTFEPDQIDAMISELRHIASSVQGSGGLWETESEKDAPTIK